jgi:hypothetical protein
MEQVIVKRDKFGSVADNRYAVERALKELQHQMGTKLADVKYRSRFRTPGQKTKYKARQVANARKAAKSRRK